MTEQLPSIPEGSALVPRLSEAVVLQGTIDQLRKDLASAGKDLVMVPQDEGAFEALRAQVLPILESMDGHSLQVALYRVDVPEPWAKRAMAAGGLGELAGAMVLRALQKVLTRLRYAQMNDPSATRP